MWCLFLQKFWWIDCLILQPPKCYSPHPSKSFSTTDKQLKPIFPIPPKHKRLCFLILLFSYCCFTISGICKCSRSSKKKQSVNHLTSYQHLIKTNLVCLRAIALTFWLLYIDTNADGSVFLFVCFFVFYFIFADKGYVICNICTKTTSFILPIFK